MSINNTDWLGSSPLYYNTETGKTSNKINDVIDLQHFDFHPEGLNNYLDYGYSVFGQTPVKNVKFLLPNASVEMQNGAVKVKSVADPVLALLNKESKEEDVIDHLATTINLWAAGTTGDIIVPTSGGFDSRLLNLLLDDKSRIKSYTYGISNNQSDSEEVVKARFISQTLDTNWEQIELGRFHKFLNYWDELYGVSTHAHGMYHVEFYSEIAKRTNACRPLLSGIIGDAWSGNVNIPEIKHVDDVKYLGYSHGANASSEFSNFKSTNELAEEYFENNRQYLKDEKFRIVASMRFKILLLSYLMRVPESLGFKPWSPFLDLAVATKMLNLPEARKQNRQWQRDLFRKHGLCLEEKNLRFSKKNTLDYQGMQKEKLEPLNEKLLREIVNTDFIKSVNKRVDNNYFNFCKNYMYSAPKIGSVLRKIGFKNDIMSAYYSYVTLKPLENLLKRRDASIHE